MRPLYAVLSMGRQSKLDADGQGCRVEEEPSAWASSWQAIPVLLPGHYSTSGYNKRGAREYEDYEDGHV